MEKGFAGLYNHVTPHVPDEALHTRLQQIIEFVEETKPGPEAIIEFQREVNHIVWEINTRKAHQQRDEEELAWMEKLYGDEDDGRDTTVSE